MSKCSRLEREIHLLRQELSITRLDRDKLYRKLAANDGQGVKMEPGKTDKSIKQDLYIAYLEEQIQRTRLKYRKQIGDVKSSASLLETKLINVREEMNGITAKAQQVDKLQTQLTALRDKLKRRDAIIARYKEEHAAFLDVINNLGRHSTSNLKAPKQLKNLRNIESKLQIKDCVGDKMDMSKPLLDFPCLGTALKKKMRL